MRQSISPFSNKFRIDAANAQIENNQNNSEFHFVENCYKNLIENNIKNFSISNEHFAFELLYLYIQFSGRRIIFLLSLFSNKKQKE